MKETLTEKHRNVILPASEIDWVDADAVAQSCTIISLEFAMEVLEELANKWKWVNIDAYYDVHSKISELKSLIIK